nr:GNAT family N-acetyltransferase [Kofleriaceae bacterium]
MNVRAIGLTTELALATTRGRVVDRGDCLVVRTPDDPSYYAGNLLVLPQVPARGELAGWLARFADELSDAPHRAFAWDGGPGAANTPGELAELVAAGFTIARQQVMAADSVVAVPAPPELAIRALTPDEVVATHALAFAMADHHRDDDRVLLRRRAAWHASLVARGDARFWGAFADTGELVASLGLVELGELARFQDVQTAPAFRRRGGATALLAAAAAASQASRLVIVAEPDSAPARLYERAGFRTIELAAWAWRAPAAT